MLTSNPSRETDLTRIHDLELRVMNLESVIKDLKMEVAGIKRRIKDDDVYKLQKYHSYQKAFDIFILDKKAG